MIIETLVRAAAWLILEAPEKLELMTVEPIL